MNNFNACLFVKHAIDYYGETKTASNIPQITTANHKLSSLHMYFISCSSHNCILPSILYVVTTYVASYYLPVILIDCRLSYLL